MGNLYSDNYTHKRPAIVQQLGSPSAKSIEQIDQLLLVLPRKADAGVWRKIPHGNKIKALINRHNIERIPAATSRIPNNRQTAVAVACVAKDLEPFQQLTQARELVADASARGVNSLGIWVLGFDDATQEKLVSQHLAAALAAAFPMPAFKSKPAKPSFKTIKILGLETKLDTDRVAVEADANNLVRWLTAMPANKLDADGYVKLIRGMAKENQWQYKKYGVVELEKLGAGAFLAVAQGNDDNSAAIVHLKYRPAKKTAKAALSLVGKGIIFDTGGTNLKPFNSMLDMHTDMSGSAVALSAFKAISDLNLPMAADCWLAITENRTGPLAYKSQDILTAANGKTIQTIHTDAEGRLALADTLVLASREKPGMIIDYATLTGSCVVALSERYSGVFSNRGALHPALKRAGRDSGERVWPFPIGQEFVDLLKSDTADIKQCTTSGGGDHILAASFLGEFVDKKIPWVHVDLSACTHKGGLAHVPTEITGFGARFTMNLVLDQNIVEAN